MKTTEIRQYKATDESALGELYHAVTAAPEAVFWWVGPEENWKNVFCAFEGQKMVAKGQVAVFHEADDNSSKASEHLIYINLKTVPDREGDAELLDSLYNPLVRRAFELKQSLSDQHNTKLCVGNGQTETDNNTYFKSKGFTYFESEFNMLREESAPAPAIELATSYVFSRWAMDTPAEREVYLSIDKEIWPNASLTLDRLNELQSNPAWKALTIRDGKTIVASAMAWANKDGDEGVIEEVLVREPWRKQGLAKYLLAEAIAYLKGLGCTTVELQVSATNQSALQLYKGMGFELNSEEVRYGIVLTEAEEMLRK
ncbi:GNAT family N-acetyltransferase [Aureibacillus halotolerans]|uniref:Acetyltransferase (GNAT) family protein n=1 Tax=Aureibacillus halotolerans TaxID=1508390 RepID=A0A4R6U8G7_9BACI|nr:GNAT family N-acetyltransferase [Aureibacillus halotolerans]TDQ41253.1 acetyltransferase (GNAT) family protein [Aureibacillus halotolerans]